MRCRNPTSGPIPQRTSQPPGIWTRAFTAAWRTRPTVRPAGVHHLPQRPDKPNADCCPADPRKTCDNVVNPEDIALRDVGRSPHTLIRGARAADSDTERAGAPGAGAAVGSQRFPGTESRLGKTPWARGGRWGRLPAVRCAYPLKVRFKMAKTINFTLCIFYHSKKKKTFKKKS